MKQILHSLLLLLVLIAISCNDENTSPVIVTETPPDPEIVKGKIVTSTLVNEVSREYIIHIPESYTGEEEFPLLFAFHGLGGNMESSYDNSKFYELTESANFIVVHPNGISANWNAITAFNNVDVDFVDVILEEVQENYMIDSDRIYTCGMSNGGYFSFLLACERSNTFAAMASVTGLMFQNVLQNCEPLRPVPVLQIHGTADPIVDYDNVDTVLNFWVEHNGTSLTPTIEDIPDHDTTDGSTVERHTYAGGNNGSQVQHLKILGGRHKWPGYEGNMDINASKEVWHFVKQYDINGLID